MYNDHLDVNDCNFTTLLILKVYLTSLNSFFLLKVCIIYDIAKLDDDVMFRNSNQVVFIFYYFLAGMTLPTATVGVMFKLNIQN